MQSSSLQNVFVLFHYSAPNIEIDKHTFFLLNTFLKKHCKISIKYYKTPTLVYYLYIIDITFVFTNRATLFIL